MSFAKFLSSIEALLVSLFSFLTLVTAIELLTILDLEMAGRPSPLLVQALRFILPENGMVLVAGAIVLGIGFAIHTHALSSNSISRIYRMLTLVAACVVMFAAMPLLNLRRGLTSTYQDSNWIGEIIWLSLTAVMIIKSIGHLRSVQKTAPS